MTPTQTAQLNLTDYEARIGCRIIDAREATPCLVLTLPIARQLSGARPLKVEIPDADHDYLTENCNRILSKEAANNVTEMILVEPPPITGWRRLLIKWRLRMQYRAECAAATA